MSLSKEEHECLGSLCERVRLGTCKSLACLRRGGYINGNKPDYNKSTCTAYEIAKKLEDISDAKTLNHCKH